MALAMLYCKLVSLSLLTFRVSSLSIYFHKRRDKLLREFRDPRILEMQLFAQCIRGTLSVSTFFPAGPNWALFAHGGARNTKSPKKKEVAGRNTPHAGPIVRTAFQPYHDHFGYSFQLRWSGFPADLGKRVS